MAIVTFPGLSINSLPQNSSLRGPMPTISIRVALLLAMALVAAGPSFAREDNQCYSSCRARCRRQIRMRGASSRLELLHQFQQVQNFLLEDVPSLDRFLA